MIPSPNLRCAHCQTSFHYREAVCPSCQALPSESEREVVKFGYQTAVIRDICTQYEMLISCFYEDTIPARKMGNAKRLFPLDDSEKVIMLGDSTVFGSNKYGFAICEFGLYWRNPWLKKSKRTYLSWDEFAKRPLSLTEYDLHLTRGDLIDMAAILKEERSQILEMMQKIQAAIQ